MSTPVIRPRTDKPDPSHKKGSRKLRVLSTDGTTSPSPSITMPRAKTELTELFAGDSLLCVRRRAAPSTARASADSLLDIAETSAPIHVEPAAMDADLGRVVAAWPDLPRNVRAAILAMIRETATDEV